MRYSCPAEAIADSVRLIANSTHATPLFLSAPAQDYPGMIMGALRLDIPFIVVTGGPM